MRISNISAKVIISSVLITMLANVVCSFIAALLIHQNFISFDASRVVVVFILLLSALINGCYCIRVHGAQLNGYLSASMLFLFFVVSAFVLDGSVYNISTLTKAFVALFVGTFLGNFLGKLQHNRLRKTRKKRRSYTK